jgi:hypothetical protein
MVDRPCTSGPPPVFARWDAVGGAEHPAEVRAVGKAPAGADGADRSRPQPGIGQVTPAAVQAATADPGRDGHVVLLKVFLADQGDKPALLANIRAIQAWAEEEQRRGIRLVEDYLRTGGPFPDRLHLIALTVRFLGFEWDAAVHRWARWAEQEVQRWPDVRDVEPNRGVFEDYLRLVQAQLQPAEATSPARGTHVRSHPNA